MIILLCLIAPQLILMLPKIYIIFVKTKIIGTLNLLDAALEIWGVSNKEKLFLLLVKIGVNCLRLKLNLKNESLI